MEIALNTINVRTDDFSWESSLNFTFNDNVVEKLNGDRIVVSNSLSASTVSMEGEAPFSYFGYESAGVWQEGEDAAAFNAVAGDPKWIDQNNDGEINDEDRTVLGDPYSDYFWGFTNTFKYKKLELSVFLEGAQGAEVFNNLMANTYFPFNTSRNRLADPIVNRWTPDNPTNAWPSFVNPQSYGGDVTNSYTISDASFVRLKNITVRYNFDVENIKFIRNASVFVSGQNLHTWTDYVGYDPDLRGTGNIKQDFNSYPLSRTFSFGVSIGF